MDNGALPAGDVALEKLFECLNKTQAIFPKTELRLVYELRAPVAKKPKKVSLKVIRAQEFWSPRTKEGFFVELRLDE